MLKYVGLDNKEYKLNTTKYLRKPLNKSKLHLRVREFLKEKFPCYSIIEEVGVKGSSKGTLYFDFMCIQLHYIVEVQGIQHNSHVRFFHKTKAEFLMAKQRDNLKKAWASLNNFTLYEFSFDEDEIVWNSKLNGTYIDNQ